MLESFKHIYCTFLFYLYRLRQLRTTGEVHVRKVSLYVSSMKTTLCRKLSFKLSLLKYQKQMFFNPFILLVIKFHITSACTWQVDDAIKLSQGVWYFLFPLLSTMC